ncbi:MAG: class I SAM-dependent methyltransferase [bacterium]|nr:class I SAM-dependent methyltransferase [bacterium]
MNTHTVNAGMNKDYESVYHTVESTHFWNVSRREFILMLLKQAGVAKHIGCAGGLLIDELKKSGYTNVSGGDISPDAVARGKTRGLDVEVMSVEQLPLPDNSVDVVILSDVIAHVDDKKALAECKRVLNSGGLLLSFCPAHPWLWSSHDEHNHHKRRYTKAMLRECVTEPCLEIERIAYWNCLLFPLQATIVLLKKLIRSQASNYDSSIGLTNHIFRAIFWAENRLLRAINLPVGISLFVCARKQEQKSRIKEPIK